MHMRKILFTVVAVALLTAFASAGNFSFSGTFNNVNQVQLVTFTVSAGQHVVIRSFGYGGGTNSAGVTIPAGGFDPLLAVFQGTGNSASLLYKNDDAFECANVNQDPVTHQCYDAYMDKVGALVDPTTLVGGFDAGTYTLVVMNYANFAKGPTFGDGFSGNGGGADCFGAARAVTPGAFLDCDGATRTGNWAVDLSGVDTAQLANSPGASLTVVSPNGGESFAAGSTLNVQWTGTNITSTVDLALLKNGVAFRAIATGVPFGAGSFSWPIPSNLPVANDYKVRVLATGSTNILDISDATFSITAAANTIKVLFPNGGESLAADTTHAITWTSGLAGNVNIALLKAGVGFKSISNGVPASAGTFNWTVPRVPAASDYKIRIMSATDSTIIDTSDANFSITASPNTITVTSPNGGESWAGGSNQTIRWTTGLAGNVNIALLKAGIGFRSIATNVSASSGSFTWALPTNLPVASDYKIRVMSASDTTIFDISDATFSIGQALNTVLVLSPNGGETWNVGTTQTIQWNAPGVGGNVNIALLKAGVGFKSIATGVAASAGSFSWTIPATVPAASDYTIRVMSADGTLIDVSNATFTVAP